MRPLSALDAISPAFSRTKLVLFSPYRFGRTWKLAITNYLGAASCVFAPVYLVVFLFLPQLRNAGGAVLEYGVVAGCVAMTLLTVVFLYLFTRLAFAGFDIVLHRGEFVAPAWRKYGAQSWTWSLFKVVLGTVVTAVVALPTAAFVKHIVMMVSALAPGEQPPPDFVFGLMSGYFTLYVGMLVLIWLSSLLGDFIVPSLALESTTLGEAFRRLGQLIRTEPGQFTAYAFLKAGLTLGLTMAAGLAVEIVLVVLVLLVALVGGLVGLLLHAIGVPSAVLVGLAITVGVAFYIFAIGYGVMLVNGSVMTFLTAYSLYFLGGRYPMLGDALEASTPQPPVPPQPVYAAYTPPPSV